MEESCSAHIYNYTHNITVSFGGVMYFGLRGEGRRKWEGIEQNIYTKVKYLSKKTRLKGFRCNHMIHNHSIPSHILLPSPLKPKYITPPKEILMSVCSMCVQI